MEFYLDDSYPGTETDTYTVVSAPVQTETKENSEDLSLAHPRWELPESVIEAYAFKNITELFEWQRSALTIPGVYDGHSILYSAPTSSGKTMVAELLCLRNALRTGRKVIFVVPFISLAVEKQKDLEMLFSNKELQNQLKVVGFYGSRGCTTSMESCDVAICTIEKANSILIKMLETETIHEIGTIVIDELHLIGDDSRGYIIELLLSKIKFLKHKIQIIGMSATCSNLDVLAKWIGAVLFVTDFRLVPLTEYVKVSSQLYKVCSSQNPSEVLVPFREYTKNNEDVENFYDVVAEVVAEKLSVLVFCATRDSTEKNALYLASKMRGPRTDARELMLAELNKCPGGIDPILEQCVPHGIAYHHAGLSLEEREIVEKGYRQGHLLVLTATVTLAAGVNLPARRVVFRTPYVGRNFLESGQYQQMRGRAGRMGLDSEGESVLMCRERELALVTTLVQSELDPVQSCLKKDTKALYRALLEAIVSKLVKTKDQLDEYLKSTLWFEQLSTHLTSDSMNDFKFLQGSSEEALSQLIADELVDIHGDEIASSRLGTAIVTSGMRPEEGLKIYKDLLDALSHFVLLDDLHVVYHATPPAVVYFNDKKVFRTSAIIPHWRTFCDIVARLDSHKRKIANAIGVSQMFLEQTKMITVQMDNDVTLKHIRFHSALILNDLIHEMPLDQVSAKYKIKRGTIQMLQQSGSTYSGMVAVFCEALGWQSMALLVAQLSARFDYGVEAELLDIMKIPGVKRHRARLLHKAGYRSTQDLAMANVSDITKMLEQSVPFQGNSMYHKRLEYSIAEKIVQNAVKLVHDESFVGRKKRKLF